MSFCRRFFFWIILCLFIGSTAAYLAWAPYRPTDLYRAIPAQAILVSSHQDLAGRWTALSTNVILRGFINTSTSIPDRRKGAVAAIKALPRISRLARKETVIAYVPALGSAEEPAWVFASWIGNASPYLRWSLCIKRIPGLDRMPGNGNGRPIWRFRQPLTESGSRLSLAFGEGIIFGCISRNPEAMRHVLMAYDGLLPSIASSPSYRPDMRPFSRVDANAGHPATRAAGALDQGWFHWFQLGRKLSESLMISYAIPRLDAEQLSAEIRIQPEFKPRSPLSETLDIPAFGQLLGELPALMCILPLDIIRDLLSRFPTSTECHVVRQALKSDALSAHDTNVVITLLAGDYSGGVGKEPLRIRIPTLIVCLKVRDPGEIKPLIGALVDNLNAHYQMGLIMDPTSLPAGKLTVNTLEATLPNLFSSLAVEDRPAYAAIGSWLILSSNAQSLVKLLERYQSPEALVSAQTGRWQAKLEESKAAVFLWMDLDICGRVLQLPLTALALKTHGNSPAPDGNSALIIKSVKTWLENARPLKSAVLWLESGKPAPAFRLEIGEDKK